MREKRRGVWELRVRVGRDPVTGQYRQVSRTVHGGRRQAEDALRDFLRETEEARAPSTKGTFGYLLSRWLEHVGPDLSKTTVKGYRVNVAKLTEALGTVPLDELTTEHLDLFYAHLRDEGRVVRLKGNGRAGQPGLSSASIERVHACARAALNQGRRWGWITVNPAVDTVTATRRSRRRRVDPPPLADLAAIVAVADSRDPGMGLLFRVAAAIGARRGELCGLRWRHVNLEAGTITVVSTIIEGDAGPEEKPDTKGHDPRTITLDAPTAGLLVAHRAGMEQRAREMSDAGRLAADAFVFSRSPDGVTPLRPDHVTGAFIRCRKAAGVDPKYRLHDLRHLNASLLLASGMDVAVVSHRLGHARTSTTQDIYAHQMPGRDREAADVLGRLLGGLPSGGVGGELGG